MTVSSTTNRVSYTGNDVTTEFSFPHLFYDEAHLEVSLVNADGLSTLKTITTDYTVTGEGVEAGGTVTMNVAPTSTETLVIRRVVPLTQLIDYINGGAFPSESHERGLDLLTMIAQQLNDVTINALRLSAEQSGADLEIEDNATTRANTVVGFDNNGNIRLYTPAESGVASLIPQVYSVSAGVTDITVNSYTPNVNSRLYFLNSAPIFVENGAISEVNSTTVRLANAPTQDSTLIVIGFATTTLNTAAASNVSTAVDGGTNVENALASRVPTVATLAALQAVSTTGLVDGSSKRDMDGRSSAGDGGAGRFVWRSGNQSANVAADEVGSGLGNGGIWIAPSSDLTGASGAWERDTGRIAFANWYFGASTGQDLTSVIQLASDNNVNLYLMPQEHRVDGTITLKEGHTIQGGGAGGLFLNAPTTATGTILNKPATGVDGPIIILKSSSTVKGIQFRHLKVNGATTGIVRLGTGAENCVYNALLDCSIYGHFTNDLTRANTCFGLYTAAGTISTVVYWNRISNVQITNCDVGVSYNAQANANHASNVVVKEARIGFWLDGGATECIDNSFSGIGVYNGQLFTPDAICFKMDNICKFNTFYGNTEAFGKAFDIDAQSVNNIFSGAFNEIVDSSVGDGNTLQGINETQQQGRVRQTNSLTGESAYILKSSRYIPTGGFQTIAEYLSTDAQASGVGAGVGLGGAFTNAGLLTVFAQIAGVKENNTSGDFGGEMELSVRPQGLPMTPVVRLGLNTQRPATDATIDSGTTSFRWKDINTMRVRTHPVTVGNLPSASGIAGTRAFVTDATTTTFASIVAGGGSNGVPVYSDGTNWRIG